MQPLWHSAFLPLAESEVSPTPTQEKNHESKQDQIEAEMRGEIPMLAGVTETTAGDIETTNFCSDGGEHENQDQHG